MIRGLYLINIKPQVVKRLLFIWLYIIFYIIIFLNIYSMNLNISIFMRSMYKIKIYRSIYIIIIYNNIFYFLEIVKLIELFNLLVLIIIFLFGSIPELSIHSIVFIIFNCIKYTKPLLKKNST